MDQSLKARLIGATVLVLLAVLLIPELLSGRKAATQPGEETSKNDRRTFTIDIGKPAGTMTAPTAPRPQPSAVEAPAAGGSSPGRSPAAETDAAEPARASGAGSVDDGQRTPAGGSPRPAPAATQSSTKGAVAPTAAAPPDTAKVPTAAGTGGGGYFVQVGAFSSVATARKLVAQLEADGYAATVSPVTRSGKTLHRVRVGPAASRGAAQQLAERLKARGLPVSLVTSD
jgi:cell division septation protein DedD